MHKIAARKCAATFLSNRKATRRRNAMATHKDYDGLEIEASHIGKNLKAHARWAWDDWYYIHVEGTFDNGNKADGIYCREQAHTIANFLKKKN
jgi:hypothetical protein